MLLLQYLTTVVNLIYLQIYRKSIAQDIHSMTFLLIILISISLIASKEQDITPGSCQSDGDCYDLVITTNFLSHFLIFNKFLKGFIKVILLVRNEVKVLSTLTN